MKLNKQNLVNSVYLIRNKENGLLKIGFTNDIERRLKEIQRAFKHIGQNPKLEVEYLFECKNHHKLETYLHQQFKDCKVQNEWFNIDNINIVIEKGLKFIEENDFDDSIEENTDENDIINYLKANEINDEQINIIGELSLKYGVLYSLEDSEVDKIISYIKDVEYLKQCIIDEFVSEEPKKITLHFLFSITKHEFYKVEFLVDLFIALTGKQPFDNVRFYMKNNFVEYVFDNERPKPRPMENEMLFKNGYFDTFKHFFNFFNSDSRMEFLNDDGSHIEKIRRERRCRNVR